MFLASAERLGVPPMAWLYRGKQGVTAQQGGIPVRVQLDDDERVTGWFVETYVLEAARGKAVGPMLVAKAKQDLPFNLSLGQSAQMRELQYSLGWRQVAPLPTYVYVLNGSAIAASKVPWPFAKLAGTALLMQQWLRRGRGTGRALSARTLDRFDARHDALWRRLRPEFPCAVVRDASYLNWKYCDQPGQSFVRLELVDGETPVGVVVFKVLEPDAAYRYRRALVVELIVSPSQAELVRSAVDALCRRAADEGADLVQLDLLHAGLEAHLGGLGFARREATRFFLVAPDSLPPNLAAAVLDPGRWLVTRGDSDTDRPW